MSNNLTSRITLRTSLIVSAGFLIISCKSHPAVDSTKNIFGRDKDTLVEKTSLMRRLVVALFADEIGIFCSGIKLSEYSILTAAHCFKGSYQENPSNNIKPSPQNHPNLTKAYVAWNEEEDLIDRLEKSRKIQITKIKLNPSTKEGAWVLPPVPDIAVACTKEKLPANLDSLKIEPKPGSFDPRDFYEKKYSFFGYGGNPADGSGRGTLRMGVGIAKKTHYNATTSPGDQVELYDTSNFFDKLDPSWKIQSACKGDSGGPVFYHDTLLIAGILSKGHCENANPQHATVSFSNLDRSKKGLAWVQEAINECSHERNH